MGRDNMDGFDNDLITDNAVNSEIIETEDPFAPENIGILHFIMLARIYDVLMLDASKTNPEAAKQLAELHRQGHIAGPAPVLSGRFILSDTTAQSA